MRIIIVSTEIQKLKLSNNTYLHRKKMITESEQNNKVLKYMPTARMAVGIKMSFIVVERGLVWKQNNDIITNKK